MVRTSRTTGEDCAGCSKWPDISPAQPRRAKTRLVPNKAAASEMKQAEVKVKAEVERGPDPD